MATETLKKYIAIYEANPNNPNFKEQLAKLKKAYANDKAFKEKNPGLFTDSKKK